MITATVESWIFTQLSFEILPARCVSAYMGPSTAWLLRDAKQPLRSGCRLLFGDFGSIVLLLVMVPTKYLVQEPGFLVRGHG